MELDRASRVVELAVCVLWIAALVVRMRSVQVALSAETFVERLEAALRLIQIGTWTLVALSIPLWMEAKWQPYAADERRGSELTGNHRARRRVNSNIRQNGPTS